MKSIVVVVQDDLHQKFKQHALNEKKSMTEILIEKIKETLKKDDNGDIFKKT